MTRQTDITKCRIEFFKQFDHYIRNVIGDDEITEGWLMLGLPDNYDEEDLEELALNDETWLYMIQVFANCCVAAGII